MPWSIFKIVKRIKEAEVNIATNVTAIAALPTSAEVAVGYVSSAYADETFVKSS